MMQSLFYGELSFDIYSVYNLKDLTQKRILLVGVCRTNRGCSGTHRQNTIEESQSWAEGTGLSFYTTEKGKAFLHSVVFELKKHNWEPFVPIKHDCSPFLCIPAWALLEGATLPQGIQSISRSDLGHLWHFCPPRHLIVCSWVWFSCRYR